MKVTEPKGEVVFAARRGMYLLPFDAVVSTELPATDGVEHEAE